MIKNTRVFFVLSVFFFKSFIKRQSLFLVSLIFFDFLPMPLQQKRATVPRRKVHSDICVAFRPDLPRQGLPYNFYFQLNQPPSLISRLISLSTWNLLSFVP